MPASSVGDDRWERVGENEAGDPMFERKGTGYFEDLETTGAAAEIAHELGVDLSEVEGSGKGGRITVADVRAAAKDD